MQHQVFKVTGFNLLGSYVICVSFDDGSSETIDFEPVLRGELFAPLRELELFGRVRLDDETHTLVWPNGADFDPETLRNWPAYSVSMRNLAEQWEVAAGT